MLDEEEKEEEALEKQPEEQPSDVEDIGVEKQRDHKGKDAVLSKQEKARKEAN